MSVHKFFVHLHNIRAPGLFFDGADCKWFYKERKGCGPLAHDTAAL